MRFLHVPLERVNSRLRDVGGYQLSNPSAVDYHLASSILRIIQLFPGEGWPIVERER